MASPVDQADLDRRFPDEDACWQHLVRMRWPEGFACPGCRGRKTWFHAARRLYHCRTCGHQQSATSGTLFHKSRIPLKNWFTVIYLMAASPNGVSMLHVQKLFGLKSYRAAWTLGHKIRAVMQRAAGRTFKPSKVFERFLTPGQLAASLSGSAEPSERTDARVPGSHGCFPKYKDAYLGEMAFRHQHSGDPSKAFDALLGECLKAPPLTLNQIKNSRPS